MLCFVLHVSVSFYLYVPGFNTDPHPIHEYTLKVDSFDIVAGFVFFFVEKVAKKTGFILL